MRIAIFHSLSSGGAKRALYEMTRRLARNHTIDVFSLSGAAHNFCDVRPFVQKYAVFGFSPLPLFAHPFGALNHGVRTLDILRLHAAERTVAQEINRGGYDVALVHGSKYTQSPVLLQFLAVPSVYCCQDALRKVYDPPIMRPYLQLTGLRDWANRLNPLRSLYLAILKGEDRANIRAATSVVVNSHFSRETIYRLYAVQPWVGYLGVDAETFRPLGLEREDFAISVGSVTPPKGFDFIIESLALVPERQRPRLLIVGNYVDPDEQRYLGSLAGRYQIQVEFRVLAEDTELVELYNRARLTLYAPILEPFGFVPLESMACGTPVVGVAEAGLRETIRHGETGILTDRDPQVFAAAITDLLARPRVAEAMGKRGPGYVQECWSWDDSVARLESHLVAIASRGSS